GAREHPRLALIRVRRARRAVHAGDARAGSVADLAGAAVDARGPVRGVGTDRPAAAALEHAALARVRVGGARAALHAGDALAGGVAHHVGAAVRTRGPHLRAVVAGGRAARRA